MKRPDWLRSKQEREFDRRQAMTPIQREMCRIKDELIRSDLLPPMAKQIAPMVSDQIEESIANTSDENIIKGLTELRDTIGRIIEYAETCALSKT